MKTIVYVAAGLVGAALAYLIVPGDRSIDRAETPASGIEAAGALAADGQANFRVRPMRPGAAVERPRPAARQVAVSDSQQQAAAEVGRAFFTGLFLSTIGLSEQLAVSGQSLERLFGRPDQEKPPPRP